jgi:hypothetical protein
MTNPSDMLMLINKLPHRPMLSMGGKKVGPNLVALTMA